MPYDRITPPTEGSKILIDGDQLVIPNDPIIPFIRGDGIGIDITPAMLNVVNAAVAKAFGGKKKIVWFEIYAGESALKVYDNDILPQDTLTAIKEYVVSIKGPLTTPVGGGFRSLNVSLRQLLDLYACVRPVRYFDGVPAPVKSPEKLSVVIFRENMEDVYAGIEWQSGSDAAHRVIALLNDNLGTKIRSDSGIGIKPMSPYGSKRLQRKAIRFAIGHSRRSVTLVHKGNIMKYTEGAFRDWGYELAKDEFRDQTIPEADATENTKHRVIIKDRIADSMFQQVLLRPTEYDVLATPNLNGDYLSDACAAQVGGLGMAPGGNLSDHVALFEATHGTAPKYAGKDQVNPGSLILSACMMLEYLGWKQAAEMIYVGIERAIQQKKVTYDLARLMEGDVKPIKSSEFGQAIVDNLG